MYSKRLIYNYIIGNDIEKLDELENDNDFLFEVLKTSKDITYYNYLDIAYRRTYSTIKYMLLNFKNELDVYKSDVDYFLENSDEESLEYKEITILMKDIDKNEFSNYKINSFKFYMEDKLEIAAIQNSSKELEKEIGLGFEVILSKYEKSSIISNYYAKCFLYEIFYEKKNFEELVHSIMKSKDNLDKIGNTSFLLDYIESLDFYLKEYLEQHIYLLSKLEKDLNLVKINWVNYINRINIRKIEIIYQEVKEFREMYEKGINFSCYDTLDKILYMYNLQEVFDLDEIKEPIDLRTNDYLENLFIHKMSNIIKDLFEKDVITINTDDYNENIGKIIEYKNNRH